MSRCLSLAFMTIVAATPVAAQVSSTAASGKPVKVRGDPSRVICRSEEQTGSRLAPATKRCMTALQWVELKQYDRTAIEQIQNARYKSN